MIVTAGGTEQFYFADGFMKPVTHNDINIGGGSLKFKDAFFAGEVNMGTLDIGGTNVTATAAELNYCDGVTSNIQTQLDGLDATPLAIALG